MVVYIGADHRGFELKEILELFLVDEGFETISLGSEVKEEGDDYPDIAKEIAKKVQEDPERARGILICGSGVGVDIAANKFDDIRAGLAISADQIQAARKEDDINILCLSADSISEDEAKKISAVFLETAFGNEERFSRRIKKISEIEKAN